MAKLHVPIEVLLARYEQGESVLALSHAFDVSRDTITRRLIASNVRLRSVSEANLAWAQRATIEQKRSRVKAANQAWRGTKVSEETLKLKAQRVEERQYNTSPEELILQRWLADRGFASHTQKAIGPYNVDLAVGSVALEVYGGHWHGSGRHQRRWPKRRDYIMSQGWSMVIIWTTLGHRLSEPVADRLASILEDDPSTPALRVILGDGVDGLPWMHEAITAHAETPHDSERSRDV